MNKLVLTALAEFGVHEVESVIRIEDKNMWVIDNKYVLKTYGDLNRLERVQQINIELLQFGVPVVKFNKTHTGDLYVKVADDVYYALMDKVYGSCIDYKKGSYSFSLGKNMAKLHLGLKNLSSKISRPNESSLMMQLHGWILEEVTKKQLPIRKEIIDYCISFDELYQKLPKQIIHRDLHGGNILFENGELSAFLDFDINQVNARLFDVCYCMDYGKTSDEGFIIWVENFKDFLRGYNSVSEITKEELEALPYMFILIQLLSVAYDSSIETRIDRVDEGIEYLDWLYDNKNKFEPFCK